MTKDAVALIMTALRCNRDFTSASSYGLAWYKYAIATQWYQFHTTDAWWFSLMIGSALRLKTSTRDYLIDTLHDNDSHLEHTRRTKFARLMVFSCFNAICLISHIHYLLIYIIPFLDIYLVSKIPSTFAISVLPQLLRCNRCSLGMDK